MYDYGLVHAYEKKVPIEEELYTDFYLPNGKVYIEYWGLENDPKYAERKKKKIEIYKFSSKRNLSPDFLYTNPTFLRMKNFSE